MNRFLLVLVLCPALLAGCLSRQVAADGKGIRQALIDLYTDQALDNLVRAYENRAFVQLSYSNLAVNDQDNCLGTATGEEADISDGHTTDLTKTGPLQNTKNWGQAGKIPAGLSATRNRILSFQADPVTNQNYIYEAYLKFAHDPSLFVPSECKPTCRVYKMYKGEKAWYWIPPEAGDAFMRLVVATSFAPPPPSPAEILWETTIGSMAPRYGIKGEKLQGRYVVTLTKAVPNDDGLLQVIFRDGRKPWLPVEALLVMPFQPAGKDNPQNNKDQIQEPSGIGRGQPTKLLYLQFSSDLTDEDVEFFTGAAALFYSPNFPNSVPKAAADSQKVLDSLDNIRLQLTKPTSTSP